MPGFATPPRPLLRFLAGLFAAATVLYSGLWMGYIRLEPRSRIGIEYERPDLSGSLLVTRVVEGSGAAAAGVRPGDLVSAIDDHLLPAFDPLRATVIQRRPGDVVRLTIDRPLVPGPAARPGEPGSAGEAQRLVLPVLLGPLPAGAGGETVAEAIATRLIVAFPVMFLVVGLVVLFMRLHDRNAWLLALLFAGFIAGAPMLVLEGILPAPLRGFALAYKAIFYGLFGAIFYYFCAVFPVSGPIDRRLPWLKSLVMAAAAVVAVPLGIAIFLAGGSGPLVRFADRVGPTAIDIVLPVYYFGCGVLGLASLVWNGLYAPTPEARRRTRVIVWGTVAGVTPFFLLEVAAVSTGRDPYELPFWAWAPCVLVVLLVPLSFAYAVVKHRVLEIPLLLKRGARYLLVQRGFTALLVGAGAVVTLLFADWSSDLLETRLALGANTGIALGAGFGILMVWAGMRVQTQVTQRIDRAFFRSAYDARQVLQNLAEKSSTAVTREELGAVLGRHIQQALHPRFLAIHIEARDGGLDAVHSEGAAGADRIRTSGGAAPAGAGGAANRIPPGHPALAEIARTGRPIVLSHPEARGLASALLPLLPEVECAVPLVGRDARLAGVILLGDRLSDEPYSGEDRRLLSSVASQAALALENIRLAGQIAERLEAERRVTVELEVAKEVQSRLLPRRVPPLTTLDCAGDCVQARVVGGDYYDFLELGGGQVGLVLADIAGKGIAGALMMASLQANLRSQSALAREDLGRMLRVLNGVLCESVAAGRYATLFFGCYEDAARRLRYVNCGHNPPILLRADGRVDRLPATATILGAFEDWTGSVEEAVLAPGDTLLVYSDGITEATGDAGWPADAGDEPGGTRDEFGEARLLDTLRRHRHLEAPALVAAIIHEVRAFSGRDQEDDITLVAARCR